MSDRHPDVLMFCCDVHPWLIGSQGYKSIRPLGGQVPKIGVIHEQVIGSWWRGLTPEELKNPAILQAFRIAMRSSLVNGWYNGITEEDVLSIKVVFVPEGPGTWGPALPSLFRSISPEAAILQAANPHRVDFDPRYMLTPVPALA